MNIEKLSNEVKKIEEKLKGFDLIEFTYSEVLKRIIALLAIVILVLQIAATIKFGKARVIEVMPYPDRFFELSSQSINFFTILIIVILLILTEYIFRNKKLYEKIKKFVIKVCVVILLIYAAMLIIIMSRI
jgi:hypothetical protein